MTPLRDAAGAKHEDDHVRTDPAVRLHRQILAHELRGVMIVRYGDGRHISYRQIDRLVAMLDGYLAPPTLEEERVKLGIVAELVRARREAGPYPIASGGSA